MRVAITQPNFLPWLGYFDLLDRVDVWVSLDNVQRSKQSFSTRNRIKLKGGGTKWLSVGLRKVALDTTLAQAPLLAGNWPARHVASIEDNYRAAPFVDAHRDWLRDLLRPRDDESMLAVYNERIVRELANVLGIHFECYRASDLEPSLSGSPQQKVFALLDHFEASEFLNFQGGVEMGLYDGQAFAARGTRLFKHAYRHPQYQQLGDDFVSYLSVVDLLLNEGPRALEVIRSGSNWEPL